MSQPVISLVVVVQREQALDSGAWVWTALPQGYPGIAGGRTIAELHEEVEALKHFIAELCRANDDLGTKARSTATALRAAGLSIRDSAAVMNLSKSRFEQLCQGQAG